MRIERRKSGSARGDEKLAAERRYGAHRLLNRSTPLLNSEMTRRFAANQSSWHGAASGLLSAPRLMRRDASACVLQCPRLLRNACVPRRSSFLPISRATRLCHTQYEIFFSGHTDLIEPLSLDEAYLESQRIRPHLPTATRVAKTIRQQIREELQLTASAGVAPNKFLAKIASDWRKPDGLFVIQPGDLDTFLPPLPVGRIPGVGKVTETRLKQIGIQTVGDLQAFDLAALETRFGRYGLRLYELARGIDHSRVIPDRPTKSISAEDTFERDIPLSEMEALIRRLAEKVWSASRKESRVARTVVLKLKTSEFNILKGTSIMVASQDPPSVPIALIELSSQIIMHKFNSPAWLKHIQKANAALGELTSDKMSHLGTGEAYVWSSKSSDDSFTRGAVEILNAVLESPSTVVVQRQQLLITSRAPQFCP